MTYATSSEVTNCALFVFPEHAFDYEFALLYSQIHWSLGYSLIAVPEHISFVGVVKQQRHDCK